MHLNSNEAQQRILIVKDTPDSDEDIKALLIASGYPTTTIPPGAEPMLNLMADHTTNAVLVDIHPKRASSGIQLVKQLRERCGVPLVLLTSPSEPEKEDLQKQLQPEVTLGKPCTPESMAAAIELAREIFRKKGDNPQTDASKTKKTTRELFVRESGWLRKIHVADILWIREEGSYIHIFAKGKQHTLRASLSELSVGLPLVNFTKPRNPTSSSSKS
ncbi:response regulator transcription factor [Algoriphagus sp. H41]|uniref:Response regulator transcription factor n=1 Tax=Algoriphagus oliviformis TaxID=2811231 RepID=A0ABS3C7Q1_9BACT|nr:response regulator transcription factor [Algoriphagus oliviformis]MBN7813048.1 response regulator transcription factor [Algoriphagus oliviformis]